jgi:hypothetical protein
MAKPPQNLEDVRHKIEQSLSEKPESDVKPDVVQGPPKRDTDDPSRAIAAARRLTDTCNKAATDIQETGETIVNVAAGIAAETEGLAELLRKHGAAIATRIEEFTALTKRVADAVEAARADVNSASAPSLTPSS